MLLINKGVYGLIMVLNDILKHLKKDGANLNGSIKTLVEDTKTYLDAIINFIKDLDDDSKINMKSSYGAGGETKYWRTFQKSIRDTFPDFQPEGLDEYLKKEEKENNTRAFQVIRDIETHFKEDFKERLEEKFGKMWLKKGLPPKLYEEAHTAAITRNREIENDEDEIEPWDCLYIISYREIALKHWQEIFEKEYTRPGEEKISGGKEEKTKWMFKLGHLRNQNAHSYFVTDEELNFIEEINDWIIKKELRNKYQVSDTQVSVTA
jgi:DNA sulfur modification protein DndB